MTSAITTSLYSKCQLRRITSHDFSPPRDSTQFDTVVPRNSLHPRRLKISPLSPADQPASRDILSLPSIGGKEKNRIARCEPDRCAQLVSCRTRKCVPVLRTYVRAMYARAARRHARACAHTPACPVCVSVSTLRGCMRALTHVRMTRPLVVCNVGLRERVRVAWFHENARV